MSHVVLKGWYSDNICKYLWFLLQAKPHIDSFRTRGNQGASFKHYESDRIPRRGPKYQHGIYEPAQS